MPGPDLHPACAALAPLLGRWAGPGRGAYPTIAAFSYTEEIELGHVGKPFVSYVQRTRGVDGAPLHAESGYLRAVGDDRIELVIAQPSGIVEIHAGTATTHADGLHLDLECVHVAGAPSAKSVTDVRRRIRVDGDELHYVVDMAAVAQPLQFHLEATLHRRVDEGR